jgi:thiamine-phosphate pyrophosphorylase
MSRENRANALPLLPFFYPILDSKFSKDLTADAHALMEAGVEMFQVRAKDWSKRAIFEIVKKLLPECNKRNARLIINDHVDVAMIAGAHGVHLGQDDFAVADARALLPESIIGISTHNETQFSIAKHQAVDYIAIGPIYPTRTKVGSTDPALGVEFVRRVCKSANVPVVCIGGITIDRFDELMDAGADGIAMISELYRNGDLYKTSLEMRERLHSVRSAGRVRNSARGGHGEPPSEDGRNEKV